MKKTFITNQKGFTLVESLIAVAIFTLLALTVYGTSRAIIREGRLYRENTTVSGLADEYMEIARNLPYGQIGTLSGNPHGLLPDLPNATTTVLNNNTYQIYYVVNYIDDSADGTILAGTDYASNDYKQVKLYVTNATTGVTKNFLTNIVPKGLESLSNGGALSIKVFDAVGQPVPNATIHITNTLLNPSINLSRTSDSSGNWIEVGLPDSANSYHVVVTKNGYSTDQTYPISAGNPNPTKPDATILNGQVSQISFSIDQTSTLTFNTLGDTCNAISGVGLEVRGSKLIGTPSVLKFDNTYTSNNSGQIPITNIEWDNYIPALTTNTYMIYGSSPIQQITILPNTTQAFNLLLGPKTDHSLLVIVKDSATGSPIKGATVTLSKTGYTETKLTSGSIWSQEDWSGGSGQMNFTDPSMYDSDNGSVDINNIPTGLRLSNHGGTDYDLSGTLISSTFDTGTASTSYTSIGWQPTSQDPNTSVSFQIATNNDNATWNYKGPDGTGTTYYTVPGTTINNTHQNDRYIRYKSFLQTSVSTTTPVITSVGFNYVSGCFAPGQAMFEALNQTDYQLDVSMPGYQSQTINPISVSGYNNFQIMLNAN